MSVMMKLLAPILDGNGLVGGLLGFSGRPVNRSSTMARDRHVSMTGGG
jgi:hypothetical protein